MNALSPSDRAVMHTLVRNRARSVAVWCDSLLGQAATEEEYGVLLAARTHSQAALELLEGICVDAVPNTQKALF